MTSDADKPRFSRLLIVDDDANQLCTLKRIFEAEGFEVVVCSTGAEALEHLNGRDIGVAVVDLRLPDSTGTELLAKLETLSGMAQVIIHTAHSSFESARDAINLGAFAYVEKGTDPDELIHHVHRAFRSRLVEYANLLETTVTERTRELRQTNEALRREAADRRRTEDAYRTLVDNSLQGLLILQDRRAVFVNQGIADILGCTIDEALAISDEDLRQLVHPEDRDRVCRSFRQRLQEGAPPSHFEHRIVRETGEVRWLEIFASSTDFNGRPAIQTAYIDITDRKRAEEAIRQSEARYRAIVEDQTEYLCRFRPDGTLTFVNRAISTALGKPSEEMIGQSFAPYVHPDDLATVMEHLAKLTPESPVQTHENRNVLPTGEIRWGQWTNRGVFDEGGRLAEIQAVGLDITERNRMEAELRQRDNELVHLGRLHTMGEMAAGLAHELNQPLYAITNYATGITLRLREETVDSQGLAEILEKISGQARRASEIIKRLRDTVQKCEPRRSSTDLNELLRDVLPLVEHELRQENISVHLELQEELPIVLADAIQIQQVALNLIRNAVDAMRHVESCQRQLTLTTLAVDGEAVEVRVGDSGKGLGVGAHNKVFDAFFTTKPDGLGMGLAISRTIVETHEGRIWATSNAPQGTVFRFMIPTISKG